ncbi:isocitrate lyase family protein [Desulfopila sp. IMCC35006]|uniref:isocitrate lyase/phosphoenolpyruvate mutase family protein n=1 Tax=Desulfopila sp. IMCC35006 TaxID=2569542 RepID=UPI0010AD3DB8|nr:isocitrate lyase family protein [Desulfopila sp. IMCC35006]TKB25203.1 isocitrate lyase family protein [Desulfopila sp. IMCC35006]
MLEKQISELQEYFSSSRFTGIQRLYSERQVAEQQGTLANDYTVAREAAIGFFRLLREKFATKTSITTFGPYSPGQAVTIKRAGIEGIYLGGWATSAKGSINEDPGADLASYPLSQVPDEAAAIVRALLTADKNQKFFRSRMTEEQRKKSPEFDFSPYIIADADTGHGGDAHVRNLIRRFVEVGVPGYHIEDQRPGTKKCGHQGGKVLVPVDEQIKRLNTARFQLDIMRVPGIIVARTDAEAATLLDSNNDSRDHAFILGATNINVPLYKFCALAVQRLFNKSGHKEVLGHLLYDLAEEQYELAVSWFKSADIYDKLQTIIAKKVSADGLELEHMLDEAMTTVVQAWESDAGIKTFPEAVAERIKLLQDDGQDTAMSVEEWMAYAKNVSHYMARQKAKQIGANIPWDWNRPRTTEGYFQIRGGIDYAIAKSLAVAPFADLIWMETKTANLKEATEFAEAIHAVYPDQMLAYNLSPSFNWDTTGMSDEEMRRFPSDIGKLGYVFNFITYGGHQADGVAGEELATALKQDGMLALARLQRKLRLIESPYTTPQSLVGGPRLDGALSACSGRTATTKAMGKGSTQFQHLIHTEPPISLLDGWLAKWSEHNKVDLKLSARLRPQTQGSDILKLEVFDRAETKVAEVVFTVICDREDKVFLFIRNQILHDTGLRRKRFMTLLHIFLIHRYKADIIQYMTPTDDNRQQINGMKRHELFEDVIEEIGDIIVAHVNRKAVAEMARHDGQGIQQLINKG